MSSIFPFLSAEQLKQQQYIVPNKISTAFALPRFSLKQSQQVNDELLGYRHMYALDLLDYQYYWQGYVVADEFRIHCQAFQPKGQTLGTVWLLHGYLEHSGLYQPLIAELLAQGFSVVIYDLPGHGLSNGIVAGIEDFAQYQRVLLGIKHALANDAQSLQHFPEPWLGIGQSTGAAIWLDHLSDYAQRQENPMIERVLLLSPLIRPVKSAWWHNAVGLNIIKHFKKDIPRYFRRNNHNPEFLRFVRLQDPLQPQTMNTGWIVAWSHWVEEMEARPNCRIPVWLAQGALDQTVDWKYNLEFIREKYRLQVSLILEEGSHQLVNERADIRSALTGLLPVFLHYKNKHQKIYYK